MTLALCWFADHPAAYALNPAKSLSQYTQTVWTQEQGLPQDTIRAIAQTTDGYLWLGTDEGLARFDGYEFVVFDKHSGDLPSNSITALYAARDGTLWIGTSDGLIRYRNKRFTTYTTRNGLPDNGITAVFVDHSGAVWIVAGIFLSRLEGNKFFNYDPKRLLPVQAVRAVYEDRDYKLWIAGFGGVGTLSGDQFVPLIGPSVMGGDIVSTLLEDRRGNLWVAGSKGLLKRSPSGKLHMYGSHDGLPDPFVRSLWEDRDGNLWAGTNGGLSRLENGRFTAPGGYNRRDRDWIRSIYEDREGNLWVGMNSGLNRFRDDVFTMYTRSEGLPSDEPITVRQDRAGRIWVGFHDQGLVRFGDGKFRAYTRANGLPSNEVFSIRVDRRGGLLVGTREGLSRLRDGRFTNDTVQDSLERRIVFDALEDRQDRIWVATPGGLRELQGRHARTVIPGGALLSDAIVVLCEGRDGSLWAGSYGKGLWRLRNGRKRLYTTADGLSSNQIRSLAEDDDGTLWIGTFGGGLDALKDGRFFRYTAQGGLLSDNVSHIEDDGRGSLWLSTTRGICRVVKQQLRGFSAGRIRSLTPTNYGAEDGLRSAQCAPGYPTGGGGTRTADGRLWFPTSLGLAVLDPNARKRAPLPPAVKLVEMTADGRRIDLNGHGTIEAESGRIQFRYTAIHLSAPDEVRYSYRLEGLDRDWVAAGTRRITNYNSLRHGRYRFVVRANIAGGPSSETSFAFVVPPEFYEKAWFLYFCAALLVASVWAAFRLRVRQIRSRFALVLEERARLAREIHDTLAQGFVGISSQLDAVAMSMPAGTEPARAHLDLARKMAHHSLTEARRSVMDLRASALEDHDLPAALAAGARQWTAGSSVQVQVDVNGELRRLPGETEQHLLRIAQEAVTNILKHASARRILVRLQIETQRLRLLIEDDGKGFEQTDAFSAHGGHFGLLGMRERAERLGGRLDLRSQPGQGTRLEVTVPLS